jgi:hypothetical protein
VCERKKQQQKQQQQQQQRQKGNMVIWRSINIKQYKKKIHIN